MHRIIKYRISLNPSNTNKSNYNHISIRNNTYLYINRVYFILCIHIIYIIIIIYTVILMYTSLDNKPITLSQKNNLVYESNIIIYLYVYGISIINSFIFIYNHKNIIIYEKNRYNLFFIFLSSCIITFCYLCIIFYLKISLIKSMIYFNTLCVISLGVLPIITQCVIKHIHINYHYILHIVELLLFITLCVIIINIFVIKSVISTNVSKNIYVYFN
ncbi:hypothetical protein NEIG_02233 [Nematocida sp. ERTm5]|nr:hypothetical protein NEIG_02233 [Nematocida sp. ERTm5]